MRQLLIFIILFCGMGMWAQESRSIFGRITDGKVALEDVQIRNADSGNETFTDASGQYTIEASPGEVLHFTYTGMKEYRIRVEDVTKNLNLIMIGDVRKLDEVTVTRSRRRSQRDLAMEYRVNPQLIRTAYGILDARTAPGRVRVVSEDEISSVGVCILDVVRNRFTGVWAVGDCQRGGYITVRGLGSAGNPRVAIYDVDGQIFTDTPLWLNVDNIKRMAIVSSLAFNVRYGVVGGGGVVVINTFGGQAALSQTADLARLRNNYIKEEVPSKEELIDDGPSYLNDLNKANQLTDAVNVFEKYRPQYTASPYFFMDMYAYFASRSDGERMAARILEESKVKTSGNPVLMKGLAYMLEENGRYKEALELYKEVFILRPHYSQSYLNLARAYRGAGEIGKSAGMIARYKYLLEEEFLAPTEEFWKILQHESDNLLALEGRRIGQRVRNILTDPYVEGTTRVVFEWNDSEAEFKLQFVNPGGQYYTWNHTYADNEERIIDEKNNGYSIAEYILDENLPGTWTVNATYLGNKSLTPTYLKVTVYTSYGERNQGKEIRQFKLFLKGVNQKLFTITNSSSIVVR